MKLNKANAITEKLNKELEGENKITFSQMIDTRNWTKELIIEFIKPIECRPNPHDPSQTMRLFDLHQVIEIEHSIAFKRKLIALTGQTETSIFARDLNREENQKAAARRRADNLPANYVDKLNALLS